jgi:hypothetical protein
MPLDVVRDERAERHDREVLPACVVERVVDELRPEAAPLARRVDLCVRERDPLATPAVSCEPDATVAEA